MGDQQGCHVSAGDVIPKISSNNSHRQWCTVLPSLCCTLLHMQSCMLSTRLIESKYEANVGQRLNNQAFKPLISSDKQEIS